MSAWWYYLVAFPAAAFLTNGIPHFVHGVSGRQFPSPFVGGPPNLDSAQRNIIWAGINFIIGGIALWIIRAGLGDPLLVAELVILALAVAYLLAGVFSGPGRKR